MLLRYSYTNKIIQYWIPGNSNSNLPICWALNWKLGSISLSSISPIRNVSVLTGHDGHPPEHWHVPTDLCQRVSERELLSNLPSSFNKTSNGGGQCDIEGYLVTRVLWWGTYCHDLLTRKRSWYFYSKIVIRVVYQSFKRVLYSILILYILDLI